MADDRRIFCKLGMDVPEDDARYNVLFVFYVDPHEYRPQQLATFDEAADPRLSEVTSFDDVENVEEYLSELNAFTAEAIDDRIDRLDG